MHTLVPITRASFQQKRLSWWVISVGTKESTLLKLQWNVPRESKKSFFSFHMLMDECVWSRNGPNYHLSLSLATFSLLVEVVQNGSPIPCDFGLLGRWIRLNSSTHVYNKDQLDERLPSFVSRENFYTFQYYSCNGKPVEINEFSSTLLQRGIREVSFVGDSHLRSVFLHMQSLIDGNRTIGSTVFVSFHSMENLVGVNRWLSLCRSTLEQRVAYLWFQTKWHFDI